MSVSISERLRRYKLIREEMRRQDLDVLVVIGRDGSNNRGNHRYLSGYGVVAAFHHYIVFPREEVEPVFFSGGSLGTLTPIARGWVNLMRPALYPEKLVVQEVSQFKKGGGIGLVEMGTIPIPIYLELVKEYGQEFVRDAKGIFKAARLVKSEEEIQFCRKSTKVADDIYLHVRNMAKPGMTDWEVYGEVKRMVHEGHCEYSMDIIDCGETNSLYAPIGQVVTEDNRIRIEITPAYEGYYTQVRADIPLSPYTAAQQKLFNAWRKAYQKALESLKVGSTAKEVYQNTADTIVSEGFEATSRVGHGIGLDVDEFLSLDPNDETVLQAGMVIVLHPAVRTQGGYEMMFGATFLLTEDGPEALNQVNFF